MLRTCRSTVPHTACLRCPQVDIDFRPFAATAKLLYEASFVSERFAGIKHFLVKANGQKPGAAEMLTLQAAVNDDPRVLPVIRAIISGAAKFTAADVFGDMARLAELRAAALVELAKIDMMLVPTAISHYTQVGQRGVLLGRVAAAWCVSRACCSVLCSRQGASSGYAWLLAQARAACCHAALWAALHVAQLAALLL